MLVVLHQESLIFIMRYSTHHCNSMCVSFNPIILPICCDMHTLGTLFILQYINICISLYIYVCKNDVYMISTRRLHMYIQEYMYKYVCMYVYLYVRVCMHVCMYVCMYASMYACRYVQRQALHQILQDDQPTICACMHACMYPSTKSFKTNQPTKSEEHHEDNQL